MHASMRFLFVISIYLPLFVAITTASNVALELEEDVEVIEESCNLLEYFRNTKCSHLSEASCNTYCDGIYPCKWTTTKNGNTHLGKCLPSKTPCAKKTCFHRVLDYQHTSPLSKKDWVVLKVEPLLFDQVCNPSTTLRGKREKIIGNKLIHPFTKKRWKNRMVIDSDRLDRDQFVAMLGKGRNAAGYKHIFHWCISRKMGGIIFARTNSSWRNQLMSKHAQLCRKAGVSKNDSCGAGEAVLYLDDESNSEIFKLDLNNDSGTFRPHHKDVMNAANLIEATVEDLTVTTTDVRDFSQENTDTLCERMRGTDHHRCAQEPMDCTKRIGITLVSKSNDACKKFTDKFTCSSHCISNGKVQVACAWIVPRELDKKSFPYANRGKCIMVKNRGYRCETNTCMETTKEDLVVSIRKVIPPEQPLVVSIRKVIPPEQP